MLTFLFTKTPLLFLIQSIWRDEAFSYFMAKKNIVDIIRLTAADFNPPFYYLLLKIWIGIFSSSEISLRLLSLIFFWLIIYFVFLFFENIFKISFKKSLFLLVLFLTNPVLVYYAFEARMYTLFGFLSVASYYFFLKKNTKYYFLFSIIGLYTHYFMIFVILSQVLYSLLTKTFKKQLKNFLNIFFSFLPWIIFVVLINKNLHQDFWIKFPRQISFLNFLGIFYLGYEVDIFPQEKLAEILKIAQYLNIFFIGFFVLFFAFYKKSLLFKDKNFFILIIWGLFAPLLIYFISLFKPIFLPRYLLPFILGFILLVTYLLTKLKNQLIFYLSIFIIIFLSIKYQNYQVKYRTKKNIQNIVKEIKALANKNDFVYVEDVLDYFPVAYYFDEKRTFIYNTGENDYQTISYYIGKVLIPENKVKTSLTIYPQKTFILRKNGNYEIRAIY